MLFHSSFILMNAKLCKKIGECLKMSKIIDALRCVFSSKSFFFGYPMSNAKSLVCDTAN